MDIAIECKGNMVFMKKERSERECPFCFNISLISQQVSECKVVHYCKSCESIIEEVV